MIDEQHHFSFVVFFRWGVIMYKTVLGLLAGMSYPELYKKVELELQIFQTAAILEVNSFEIFFRLA